MTTQLVLCLPHLLEVPAAYHEQVTNQPPTAEPEPQWQQPSFSPGSEAGSLGNGAKPSPLPSPFASGSVIIPSTSVPPPSVAETMIATVAGVVWPVMIVLAIMGAVGWWEAILIAIVGSAVLGNVRGHLKARRKALGRAGTIPTTEDRPR